MCVNLSVLIAVKKQFVAWRMFEWESDCEDVWIKIKSRNSNVQLLNLCAVYLPPPVAVTALDNYLDKCSVGFDQNCSTIILGDFNLSGINWELNDDESYTTPNNYGTCPMNSSLIDFMALNDIVQHNHIPNSKNKILDLVLSNTHNNVTVKECTHPLRDIDELHPPLDISIATTVFINKTSQNTIKPKYNFRKANYEIINNELSDINWNNEFNDCSDVNYMVSKLYEILRNIIKSHVPFTPTFKYKNYPVWFSPSLVKMLKLKHKYHTKYKKHRNPLDKIEFNYLRADCERVMRKCYNDYIISLEILISKNPKYFWSHIKKKRNFSSNYPPTMSLNDVKGHSVDVISDLFAKYFSSVFEADDNVYSNINADWIDTKCSMRAIHIEVNSVRRKLENLDLTKGAGPDNIPPQFIVKCAEQLSTPLFLIFNHSLLSGIFPEKWKEALIVPIHKNGKKDLITNYRPISILCTFAKVFESLVYTHIYNHVRNQLSPFQHGFMTKRSTNTNLFQYVDDVAVIIDNSGQVDAIYTDFSKAFDKVNHSILLEKLHQFDIEVPLLRWCSSYLNQRPSQVVIDGHSSNPFIASSGVPQGSILGPLFFNIFINEITNLFKYSTCYLFADDLKIMRVINDVNDAELLQRDIDKLVYWCQINKMYLNISKCLHIKFTLKRNIIPTQYHISGECLSEVSQTRDLGVELDTKLNFTKHIDQIIDAANKSLGFVLRNGKEFKKVSTTLLLYNSYVRSKLDYCSTVWCPTYKTHINRIERIQKKLLRHMSYRFRPPNYVESYVDRAKYFKMQTLSDRRDMLGLCFLHQVMSGTVDSQFILNKFSLKVPSRLPRRPVALFSTRFSRTNLGKHSPTPRLTNLYNNLVRKVENLDIFGDSLPIFKNKIIKSCC